jgi:SAM-dependent methyltransferase
MTAGNEVDPWRGDMPTSREKEQSSEDGLGQTIFKPCADFLVRQAKLRPDERLLDIGCGSGTAARVAIERQPDLGAAQGFDYEESTVALAQKPASQRDGKEKLSVWKRDAARSEAYKGPRNVRIAQHIVQHVPEMLVPIRVALAKGGRVVICTWPAASDDCPAHSFLYQVASEEENQIGNSMSVLHQKVSDAGFHVEEQMTVKLLTPSVTPIVFLRQYPEGRQHPPKSIDDYLTQTRVMGAAKETAQIQNGLCSSGLFLTLQWARLVLRVLPGLLHQDDPRRGRGPIFFLDEQCVG